MKPFVHLQGAGQEVTVITSTTSSSAWPPDQATLVLASDTSLRDLTLGNSGAGDNNAALLATAGMTRTLAADVTARAQGGGSSNNYAIYLSGSGTSVTLQQITALAKNSSGNNYGLFNYSGAVAVLHGGDYTVRGGNFAVGIYNGVSGATLEAVGVTALAENGSENYGLENRDGAEATLRGGSFTGRGGTNARGIYNTANAALEAVGVTALAEDGSNVNGGLLNEDSIEATLHGGSFTGRGGTYTRGISNSGSGTTLAAKSVTTLGEDGSTNNLGLYNLNSGTADVTQSVLEGATYSVIGVVTVSNSRLVGGVVSGGVTCVLVTRGTTISTDGSTCP
jgi:hypothetical protein